MLEIIEEKKVSPTRYGEDDHDRFAHYAPKAEITKSLVEGVPIKAICGKVWVVMADGAHFPVCPSCKEIYETLP